MIWLLDLRIFESKTKLFPEVRFTPLNFNIPFFERILISLADIRLAFSKIISSFLAFKWILDKDEEIKDFANILSAKTVCIFLENKLALFMFISLFALRLNSFTESILEFCADKLLEIISILDKFSWLKIIVLFKFTSCPSKKILLFAAICFEEERFKASFVFILKLFLLAVIEEFVSSKLEAFISMLEAKIFVLSPVILNTSNTIFLKAWNIELEALIFVLDTIFKFSLV